MSLAGLGFLVEIVVPVVGALMAAGCAMREIICTNVGWRKIAWRSESATGFIVDGTGRGAFTQPVP